MTEPLSAERLAEIQARAERYPVRSFAAVGIDGTPFWDVGADLRDLLAEIDRLHAENADLRETPRDEHHTLEELYEYRMLYNAATFNAWHAHGEYEVVKSWYHSDGELCFGGGWFIVVASLPSGQISNHYRAEYWSLFSIPAVFQPPEYDGHTPQQAAERLHQVLDVEAEEWRQRRRGILDEMTREAVENGLYEATEGGMEGVR